MKNISQLRRSFTPLLTLLLAASVVFPAGAEPLVRIKTVVGEFFIDLTPNAAPVSVENFLFYVNSGAYNSSLIHRSDPGFVIQGGGFVLTASGAINGVPTNPAIVNEFNQSNLRGTVALARSSAVNSATSQWFVNLSDTNTFLDGQNGGFTVFGTINEQGMQVVDDIATLPIVDLRSVNSALGDSPVLDRSEPIGADDLVVVSAAQEFSTISPPAAAILPASRSVGVGVGATAFATVVNSADSAAASCSISPETPVPTDFVYRRTNPANNEAFGANNPLLDIPALGNVSVVFSFTPTASFANTEIAFNFDCGNASAGAAITPGVNTFELSASNTPGADVVALAATVGGIGINDIPNSIGSGAFAVATVNVGAQETITASADTGSTSLPLGLFICPTDAAVKCTTDPAATATLELSSNETATFSVFAQLIDSSDSVAFDPAANRAFVRFRNAAGQLRGSTSVALRTVP